MVDRPADTMFTKQIKLESEMTEGLPSIKNNTQIGGFICGVTVTLCMITLIKQFRKK